MAKKTAMIFGIILLIVGVWGFFGGGLSVGVFAADTVGSVIHVILGIILLAVAAKPAATMTLKVIGILYIIFAILGFVSGDMVLGIFATNGPANWLYLVAGIIMAACGWSGKKDMMSSGAPQM
ncbi:MAG: hypothetical protein QOG91_630 [Candidatus Parcubacteria bacterium]|jgi:hypothetical protein|nr:hypothetical protein [Candidatus Parcubacteria bacterium]